MSVTPDNLTTKISPIAFAFVYGNNSNSMTVYNAMLNVASAYASDSTDEESENGDENDCIDSEVLSESVDKTKHICRQAQHMTAQAITPQWKPTKPATP